MLYVYVQKNVFFILILQLCMCMGFLKGLKNDFFLFILEYLILFFLRFCFGIYKYIKFNLVCMKNIFCIFILLQIDIESFELELKKC